MCDFLFNFQSYKTQNCACSQQFFAYTLLLDMSLLRSRSRQNQAAPQPTLLVLVLKKSFMGRNLQTRINEAIVRVQAVTANPKTDTRLGKVGRQQATAHTADSGRLLNKGAVSCTTDSSQSSAVGCSTYMLSSVHHLAVQSISYQLLISWLSRPQVRDF